MSTLDAAERSRRWRIRIKLFGAMLTTYGYALLAGGAWEPLSKGEALTVRSAVAVAVAVAMHVFSLYIAPHGEPR